MSKQILGSAHPVRRCNFYGNLKAGVQSFVNRYGAALEYREFRTMWTANAFAQAAAWGLIVARGQLVFNETHSSFWVGATTFAAMAPLFVVPPVVGVLADRMDRRSILAASYALNSAQNLALFFGALFGVLDVWMIVALAVVNGVARATQQPTSQALAATLVPRERLLNALSLNASTQHGSRLIGPGIVTPMLAVLGAPPAFLLCAVFYFIGLWQIMHLTPKLPDPSVKRESFFNSFAGGVAYVYSMPVIRFMILLAIFHCGLTMAFESLLPGFSANTLAAGKGGFGTLLAGVGAGALVASLFISGIQTSRARGNVLMFTGFLSGLGQTVLALTSVLWLATIAAALMGGAEAAFMTMTQAVTQATATDEYRGRVASLNTVALGGMMATMNLFNGTLADQLGASTMLFWEGLIFVGVVTISLFAVTGRRVYGRAPSLEAVPI
jgi:MFS family permease